MHVMSKDSILEAAKRAFASEFIVGDAESHPREFSYWLNSKQLAGNWWGAILDFQSIQDYSS